MELTDLYLSLFLTFLKIGVFGFGGGYAMLPLIQREVVDVHGWISVSDFTDIVAISQTTPGPIAFNSATYIGYTAVTEMGYEHGYGVLGSAICTLAVSIPSLVINDHRLPLLLPPEKQSLDAGISFSPEAGHHRPDCSCGAHADERFQIYRLQKLDNFWCCTAGVTQEGGSDSTVTCSQVWQPSSFTILF